jgi:hypothetical protein
MRLIIALALTSDVMSLISLRVSNKWIVWNEGQTRQQKKTTPEHPRFFLISLAFHRPAAGQTGSLFPWVVKLRSLIRFL